ncbi:MAG: hypothetical protein ACTHN0_01960 [Aquihabitans sp.]
MTDGRTPDLPDGDDLAGLGEDLGPRLHAAADHVDGAGVTRAGVLAAVDRRRRQQRRSRTLVASAAAAIAVVGGLAVVTRTDGHGPEHVESAATTTVPGACVDGSIDDPAGWFRLSSAQADRLLEAGTITAEQAAEREDHAVQLTFRDFEAFDDGDQDMGKQLFQLGYEDAAGIDYLRAAGLLTERQEASVADGIAPVLVASQVDALFAHFPDLVAVSPGGHPFATSNPEVPSGAERGALYDGWVDVLRSEGLLTPEQEAAAEAGEGFTLSAAQTEALQAHWDQQAAGTTTTALSFAPGSQPTTTVPDPCAGQLPANPGGGPQARPTTTRATASDETTTTT